MKKIILITLALSVMFLSSCSDDAKKKEEQQRQCNAAFTSCNTSCTPITKPDIVTPAITTPEKIIPEQIIPPSCTCSPGLSVSRCDAPGNLYA